MNQKLEVTVTVTVHEGVRVKGPAGGKYFGWNVDVNQQFMVVSSQLSSTVYVYQSYSPFNMVARFPMDNRVGEVVISDDNTIVLFHCDVSLDVDCWLTIY